MLRIPDFTMQEIENIKAKANFTDQEERLFDLRNKEYSLEQCAEEMKLSGSTIDRLNRKLKMKIIKVI